MDKLAILFITRKFPPAVGGMEKHAYGLYRSIDKLADVKLVEYGGSAKFLPLVLPYFLIRSSWLLLTKKIDVIHIHDGLLLPLGISLKFVFRKPLCVMIHGLDVTYKNKFYQIVIKFCLKRADRIICISATTKEEVLKRGGLANKTAVILTGMDDDIFSSNHAVARQYLNNNLNLGKDDKLILSIGRLVERKGAHWFIAEVMPNLVKADASVKFLISGDGNSRSLVERAIKKTGLQANVRLLGRTSNEMRRNLYNGADLFIMPNIPVANDMEGFGLVLLEASLCELPVVAADLEGIKDAVIDGKNGVLVKPQNADVMQKAVIKFLNDKTYARKFGKSSRSFTANNYQWPLVAQKYMSVYDELKAH